MSDIKAIETLYNGFRFRSRLEARWAVFFDALGIKYDYEKEGFQLDSGNYLPDFWLPDYDCWIEIKGQPPTPLEIKLGYELCHASSYPCIIFSGLPNTSPGGQCHHHDVTDSSGGCGDWEDIYWAICMGCRTPQFTMGKDRRWGRDFVTADYEGWRGQCQCEAAWDTEHTRILSAVNAAKQARFEHGQKGL